MTIALIIAGGTGQRMHLRTPKQFLSVRGKPVIVHTLERFERHPSIDAICVVTLPAWKDIVRDYARKWNVSKLRWIADGGSTGQESIRNGALEIARHAAPEDVVVIHDAIRPMVSAEIISENLALCRERGNAIAVIPCAEVMCRSEDGATSTVLDERNVLWRTQTPQSLPLGSLLAAQERAIERGMTDVTATVALLIRLGIPVHFSSGSEKNVKITTQDDLAIFRALLSVEENPSVED